MIRLVVALSFTAAMWSSSAVAGPSSGRSARAQGSDLCNPGSAVAFYPSGKLKSCGALKDYYRANNIRCNKLGPAEWFESGHLKACVLADPATVGGQPCNQYGPISFHDDGSLDKCIKPPTD